MNLYRVDVLIAAVGQEIMNTLWYRPVGSFSPSTDLVANVMGLVIAPVIQSALPSQATITGVRVVTYSSVTGYLGPDPIGFDALALVGAGAGASLSGAYLCATMAFTLGAITSTSAPITFARPWRRSHIALGPMADEAVLDNAMLNPGEITLLTGVGEDLAAPVDVESDSLQPIRVRWGGPGQDTLIGAYADVVTCVPRPKAGTRRSRFA